MNGEWVNNEVITRQCVAACCCNANRIALTSLQLGSKVPQCLISEKSGRSFYSANEGKEQFRSKFSISMNKITSSYLETLIDWKGNEETRILRHSRLSIFCCSAEQIIS